MGASIRIGRVGGLAVALGVSAAVLAGHGPASADTGAGSSPGSSSDAASDASSASSGPSSATESDVGGGESLASESVSDPDEGSVPRSGSSVGDGSSLDSEAAAGLTDAEARDLAALSDSIDDVLAEADVEPIAAVEVAPPSSLGFDVAGEVLGDDPGSPPAGDDPSGPADSAAALALLGSARREPAGLTSAAPAGRITVSSVDVEPGDGVVNGVIDAVSARGLSLNYSVASAPNRGGQLSLDPAGEFTLAPTDAAVTAGGVERFSVLIAEKTSLEAFLEKIPLLGALVPQFFATLREIPIVSDLLAPLIGYAVVNHIDVDLSGLAVPIEDEPTPIPLPAEAAAGWNLYSWQASSNSVVDAIDRQEPGLVRWIVEMDRFLEDETNVFRPPRSWSWDTDTTFDGFFEALADNDTTLVVALWNKDTWAKSMRACGTCGWPKIDEFAAFVQDLEAEIERFGVNVIFEAQNEPDLRWGSLNAATNIGATENFTTPWHVGWPEGYAQYRGGTGSLWQQMHDVVESPFASGGIISRYTAEITLAERLSGNYSTTNTSTRWIDATAPLVEYTSFHRYGLLNTTVEQYVDWVYHEWSIWSDRKGSAVPFYIGEIGPSSTGSVEFTNSDAAKMREIHADLDADPRFEDAYLGMTAHVANLSLTSLGWWNPAFDVSDVAG